MRPLLVATLVAGCTGSPDGATGGGDGKGDDTDGAGAAVDVRSTDLAIDLAAMRGRATIALGGGPAVLEVGDLAIESVTGPRGGVLDFEVEGGRLTVADPPRSIVVDYGFRTHDMADGVLANGSTLLWPYFCGNVFPCHPAPGDGQTFTLALDGVPAGQTAVFPAAIEAEAPAYQLAWAVGEYGFEALGATSAGTRVGVYWLPRGKTRALEGTRNLVAVMDWFERTLGPYAFGDEVAAVSVRWGGGAFGGMEHHPYWHVAEGAMGDEETQAHEAAHGWFGDGVRIRCWEDFVLSEGTVSYLAARALGQTAGAEAEAAIWRDYAARLDAALADEAMVAWPDGCGEVDILKDGLFSDVPYMKGAFFYKAVANRIGADELDGVLGRFYEARVGTAAGMQDMIDAIREDTGFDATSLARTWLQRRGRPATLP